MSMWYQAIPQQVLQNFVEDLGLFSNKDAQMFLWDAKGNNGEYVGCFSEQYCTLFNDTGLDDALDENSTGLPTEIDEKLKLLDKTLSRIDQEKPQNVIIESEEMDVVRELASKILILIEKLNAEKFKNGNQ